MHRRSMHADASRSASARGQTNPLGVHPMRLSHSVLCAVALSASASAVPAFAADDEDLAAIRQEMKALRGDYEKKIDELERRLKKAEKRAEQAEAAATKTPAAPVQTLAVAAPAEEPAPPPPPPPAPVTPRAPTNANAFNPAISVILNGSYAAMEDDPALATVPGFSLGEEAGLIDRGFSLGESELAFTANVDPYFLANLIVSIGNDDSISVEEAFI